MGFDNCLVRLKDARRVAFNYYEDVERALERIFVVRGHGRLDGAIKRELLDIFHGQSRTLMHNPSVENQLLTFCLRPTGKRKCKPEEPPPPMKFIPEEPPDVEKEPEGEPEPAPEEPPITQGPYIPPQPAIRDPACPGNPFWAYSGSPAGTCGGPPPPAVRWATAHEEYDAAQDRWHLIYD